MEISYANVLESVMNKLEPHNLGERQTHIADPSDGATQDAEARTAINAIIDNLEVLKLFKDS